MSAGFSLVHMERYLSISGLLDHSRASSCIPSRMHLGTRGLPWSI